MSNEQQGAPVPPQVPSQNNGQQQGWQATGSQPNWPAPNQQQQGWGQQQAVPQAGAQQAWGQQPAAPQPGAQQQWGQQQGQQAWGQQAAGQQQAWGQGGQQQWQQPQAGAQAPTWEQLKATGQYQVPPEYPAATFNPESFSIAAFFFSWIWYLVKGMTQKGLLLLGAGFLISLLTGGIGGIALAIYAGMYGHRDYVRYHNSKIQFWW